MKQNRSKIDKNRSGPPGEWVGIGQNRSGLPGEIGGDPLRNPLRDPRPLRTSQTCCHYPLTLALKLPFFSNHYSSNSKTIKSCNCNGRKLLRIPWGLISCN